MNYNIPFQEQVEDEKVVLSGQGSGSLEQVRKQENEIKESKGAIKIKSRPNHKIYLQVLDKMGPEQRLAKAFELSAISRSLFLEGLRRSFPEKNEDEIKRIYLNRIAKCSNRNY